MRQLMMVKLVQRCMEMNEKGKELHLFSRATPGLICSVLIIVAELHFPRSVREECGGRSPRFSRCPLSLHDSCAKIVEKRSYRSWLGQ